MSHDTLAANNYRFPPFGESVDERCRDCAEKMRSHNPIGNAIECKAHLVEVRHSHRCEQWHRPGTLFA